MCYSPLPQAQAVTRPDPVAERLASASSAGPRLVVDAADDGGPALTVALRPADESGEALADRVRRRARERKR